MAGNIFGGWVVKPQEELPKEVAAGFSQVMEVGVKYTPLLYGGSQIVAGINHLIICEGQFVTEKKTKILVEMVLNEAPRTGDFSLVGITPIIDAADGGWVVNPSLGGLPQHLATGIGIMSSLVGASYELFLYCGSQVVNGTNYMIICKQTLMTLPKYDHLVKVVLNEALPEAGKIVGEFSIVQIDRII